MTLTHEQIAAMTSDEVNVAVAKRNKGVLWHIGENGAFGYSYSPTTDWRDAGRLLEMMVTDEVSGFPLVSYHAKQWGCFAGHYDEHLTTQHADTATEAIARCWLEWWEVTHVHS